jgi:hypothetical protein
MDEPRRAKSINEQAELNRALDRKLILDPISITWTTDIDPPAEAAPSVDNPEPTRQNERMDRAEPIWPKLRTEMY